MFIVSCFTINESNILLKFVVILGVSRIAICSISDSVANEISLKTIQFESHKTETKLKCLKREANQEKKIRILREMSTHS